MEENKKDGKRRVCFHKIFNIISIIFLLTCITVYGIRFVTLYMENNKTEKTKQIADNIKDDNANNENFKNIKGDYYFSGSDVNNYMKYSNFMWRIIKIDKKGNVVITLDNSVTSLSRGSDEFNKSSIIKWLNKSDEGTGVFENVLNDTPKYLTYTESCIDDVDDTNKITCKKKTSKTYVSLPSLSDYVNTGSSDSFLNTGSYYYLANKGSKNVWCVDEEGKISTSDGNDIIGIKPVVTIKSVTKLVSGNGSVEKPYIIESEIPSMLGSIVKLDNDLWQVYSIDGENVRLVLTSYLSVNGKEIENKYSKAGYQFNVDEYGSLANYLNNRYLNNLNYKNILEEFELANGAYVNNDYMEVMKNKVNVKVGILSIGDMILNQSNKDYYLASGTDDSVFTYQGLSKISTSQSNSMLNVIPTISIKKSLVVEYGTIDAPYEVKYE